MNNRYITSIEKVNYGMALLLMASIPLPRRITQYVWVIFGITWLLEGRWLRLSNLRWEKQLWPAVGLALWVLWEALSLLWGSHSEFGGQMKDAHYSMLILPLVLLFGLNSCYDWRQMARVYVGACLLSIPFYWFTLYWVCNADYVVARGYSDLSSLSIDFVQQYASSIKHRLFYCTDLTFAMILLYINRRDYEARLGIWGGRLFCTCATLFMMAIIFITGSRASLLFLPLWGIVALVQLIPRSARRWTIPVLLALLAVTLLGVKSYHPRMRALSFEWFSQVEQHYREPGFEPRLMIWHVATEHPEDYTCYGLGVGNATPYLIQQYRRWPGLEDYAERAYCTHSQYLEVWMELGLVAMLAFIALWIALPLCQDKRSRAYDTALYVSLIWLYNSLTDCMLSRIEGVILCCTMLLLLRCMDADSEKNSDDR